MNEENWIVDDIGDDGWTVLRRDVFVYSVPRDVLPEGLSEGDVLQKDGAKREEYGRWKRDRHRAG